MNLFYVIISDLHYLDCNDVQVSQITGRSIVCSTICSANTEDNVKASVTDLLWKETQNKHNIDIPCYYMICLHWIVWLILLIWANDLIWLALCKLVYNDVFSELNEAQEIVG